jgi:cell wall-associated NlpC family hydrolase
VTALCAALACLAGALAVPSAAVGRPGPTPSATASAVPGRTAAPTFTAPTLDPLVVAAGARAQDAKDRADRSVAALRLRIAARSKELATLSADASAAEQQYTVQLAVEARARSAAAQAGQRLIAARAAYSTAEDALNAAAVDAYESTIGADSLGASTFGYLLIAPDPSSVLDAATQQRMLVEHQGDVTAQIRLAVAEVRAAETQQRATLAAVARETARLGRIRAQAETARATAQRVVAGLAKDLRAAKATQQQADVALSSFLGGWSTADPKRASQLNVTYAKLALRSRHVPPAARSAQWTPAMGRTAVLRALQYLGVDYAWAGGNGDGPTRGVCAAGDAYADCTLVGFDCSGLALYAWAPYLSMAHFAATQYLAGSVHPAPTELLPGDLLFWSSDGTAAGIHHVAIYVGNGNVIQAPQSGDIVRITPVGSVSSGYFGATRPLT